MSPTIIPYKERRRCARACGSCKRRKERCNGSKPCQRCRTRGVADECQFSTPSASRLNRSPYGAVGAKAFATSHSSSGPSLPVQCCPPTPPSTTDEPSSQTRDEGSFHLLARLIECEHGTYSFLGDSSASALLRSVRQFARISVGDCPFVTHAFDPTKGAPVKRGRPRSELDLQHPPFKPDIGEAQYLTQWSLYSTSGVLGLFEKEALLADLVAWVSEDQSSPDLDSAVFYLILAIGAQTCPEDKDVVAEEYYNYGRYLASSDALEGASMLGIQCYALVTMYLMGLSRIEAAFVQFGLAVRAAYALGLHRTDMPTPPTALERRTRERLWKVIRVYDVYFSVTLGRPMATCEPRNTMAPSDYSATIDLCKIFESVLTELCVKSTPSEDVLEHILDHSRRCAAQFADGLKADGVQPSEHIESGTITLPNIGLYHMKLAFYAATWLLTKSFLVRTVLDHISSSPPRTDPSLDFEQSSAWPLSPLMMSYACIDSAISSVELFRELLVADQVPRRLPFIVNSIFCAALVLGLATFGDHYLIFPLEETLDTAYKLLRTFERHDWLARHYAEITAQLAAACRTYVQKRSESMASRRRALAGKLFGILDQSAQCRVGQEARGPVKGNGAEEFSWKTQLPGRDSAQPAPSPQQNNIPSLNLAGGTISMAQQTPRALQSAGHSPSRTVLPNNIDEPFDALLMESAFLDSYDAAEPFEASPSGLSWLDPYHDGSGSFSPVHGLAV